MESIQKKNDIITKASEALLALSMEAKDKGAGHALEIPNRKEIIRIIKALQQAMFPGYFDTGTNKDREALLYEVYGTLKQQVTIACRIDGNGDACNADEICTAFVEALPRVYSCLLKDIEALYAGDPAAKSREEVIIAYPGFYAISIYRIAHELYGLGVPYIPRMMTEYAHEKTGIDIHAGASIGDYFFIDHGTGIVIGETTVIGDHVKLYQGVTLGAKSFPLDAEGKPVKNIKRHPHIGNNVIIYANATILGGNTYIGDGCVIGGSVWLMHSVEAGSVLYFNGNK